MTISKDNSARLMRGARVLVIIVATGLLACSAKAGTPVVETAGVTTPDFGEAALSGRLVSDGDAVLDDLRIYFGESDGGTNAPLSWDTNYVFTSVSVGATFSTNINGLAHGTEYFYCVHASNVNGDAWSAVTNFTTPDLPSGSYMQITFTNFASRGVLTNFPALVKLTAGNTDNFKNLIDTVNGYDLRFWGDRTLSGEPLNYQIERFDTNGTSYIWVHLPALTQNTSIWASWGDLANQAQLPCTTNGAVWGSAFKAVWHMGEPDAEDSTANNHDGAANFNTDAVGQIGGAQAFNGTSSYIDLGASAPSLDFTDGDFSISAWVLPASTDAGNIYDNRYEINGTDSGWIFGLDNNGALVFDINGDNDNATTFSGTGAYVANTWQQVGVVKTGTTMTPYVNGEPLAPVSLGSSGTIIYDGSTDHRIGMVAGQYADHAYGIPKRYYNGVMDELRISDVALGSNWVWACYMNQGSGHDSFIKYGSLVGPPVVVAAGVSTPGFGEASLSGTLVSAGGATVDAVRIYFGATNGGTNAPLSWDTNVVFSSVSEGDTFSTNLTGLLDDSEYYYAVYASNANGEAWSAVTNFTTPTPPNAYSIQITFTNLAGRGTLTDFPALVKLVPDTTDNYNGFLDTTTGYDLRFWDNAALFGTPLNYEIEAFDTNANSYIWVQVPELTQNTSIWASWGDPANQTQLPCTTNGAVWGSEFKAVWHMGDMDGQPDDATTNANDAVGYSSLPPSVAGQIGAGNDFVELQYVDMGSGADFSVAAEGFTLSGWMFRRDEGNEAGVLGAYNAGWIFGFDNVGDHMRLAFHDGGWRYSTQVVSTGVWTYVAYTFENNVPSDVDDGRFYIDGSFAGASDSQARAVTGNLHMNDGGPSWGNRNIDGVLDEFRIESVARSTNWIWASYMNQGGGHDSFVEYGAVVAPDAPLTISSLSPTNNATDVATYVDLVVSFSRNIVANAGNVVVTNLSGPTGTYVIPVSDPQISVSGTELTINPSSLLAAPATYAVRIDPGAIKDDAATSFAGITNDTTWTFTTQGDAIAPTILEQSPAAGATSIAVGANLVASFSEPIALTGAGTITIRNLDGGADISIDLSSLPDPDATVVVSGTNLTVDLTGDLGYGTNYAIRISADAIADLSASANPFAGIVDDTTWTFTTIPPEAIAPTIILKSPADDAVRVALGSVLVASFDEPVVLTGNGSITLTDLTDGSSTETFSLPDATRVTVASSTNLTIQPPVAGFENDTEYAVQISSDAIQDLSQSPNLFAGIADSTNWNFSTVNTNLFVIKPVAAIGSTEYTGRTGADTFNAGDTAIDTGDPIPSPWPTVGVTKTDNWLALDPVTGGIVPAEQWITLDLGAVYRLDGVYAWNYWDAGSGPQQGANEVNVLFAASLSGAFGSPESVATDYSGWIATSFAIATSNPEAGAIVNFDSSVDARYVLIQVVSTHGATDRVGIGELRFVGETYVPPPTLASVDPLAGTTVVTPASLTATFSETITTNTTGSIVITNLTTGGAADVIPVGSPELSFSASNLVITPTSPVLSDNNVYAVLITSNAIKSASSGIFYAGISDTNAWQFSTKSGAVAPQIRGLVPTNGTANVPLGANLLASFDQDIYTNTAGAIVITNLTQSSVFATIPIGDGSQISISGTNLTISPSGSFADDMSYAVLIDTNALKNLAGTFFGGITNASDWTFTTVKDATAPAVDTLSPTDGARRIATNAVLQVIFDEPVAFTGAGSITITDLTDGSDNRTISALASQVLLSSSVLTIDPTDDFEAATEYEMTIPNGVIQDLATSPNSYGGTTSGEWTFTTVNPNLFVIKPLAAIGSTEFTDRTGADTLNAGDTAIDTGDPIPSPWPTVGVTKTDNWLALDPVTGGITPNAQWITFDLGSVYSLEGIYTWNYWDAGSGNQQGANAVNLLFATSLSDTFGSGASVSNDYAGSVSTSFPIATANPEAGAFVAFDASVEARYVLVEVVSTHGASDRVGLGEVRFSGELPPDTYPPTIEALSPQDDRFHVPTNRVLVATFNEGITLTGSGSITITDLTDGSSTETISLPDATRVTASGTELSIQPPATGFEALTEYAVQIGNDAVQDLADIPNLFGGLADSTSWTFTTVDPERFVIRPLSAVASSEYPGRLAVETYDSHNILSTIIETRAAIPDPWPEADTDKNYAWLSNATATDQWITFDLGRVYRLDGVYMWNYNDVGSTDSGIKDCDILFAMSLSDTFGSAASVSSDYSNTISRTFAEATARPEPGEFVSFDTQVLARYVLFDIATNHGASSYVGFPETRFTGVSAPPLGSMFMFR